MRIKSYIYLDNNKMYSLSSQLFEGITQYIMKEQSDTYEEEHSQKGELLSGRLMADMIMQKDAKSEMKYLHDFAFNLFEQELVTRGLLYDVTNKTSIEELRDKGFVRIKGKIIFENFEKILYTLEHFNEVGRSVGELTMQDSIESLGEIENNISIKHREQKNKINQRIKHIRKEFDAELKEQGLIIDEKLKNNLYNILKFGYGNIYEVMVSIEDSDLFYTAIINQENLKETEQSLISKYSRLSEKEFTLIGVVTQCGDNRADVPCVMGNEMKSTTLNIIDKIAGVEEQFNGRAENECIIDPIAIYSEI